MKARITGKRLGETGMASIVITMVTMVVISLIVLGFAVLSRREQRQTLDQQLSTQAFYAAESGVEDARAVIKKAISSGQPIVSKPDCTTAPAGTYPVGSGMDVDAAAQVSYTCLKVDPAPKSLLFDGINSSNIVVPVSSLQTIDKLEITWSPTNNPSGSPSACPTSTANSFSSQPNWGCGYGIMRADIVPTDGALTRNSLSNGALTGFFEPLRSNAAGTLAYNGNAGKPSTVAANCDTAGYTQCKATISFAAPVLPKNLSLRLSSMYQPSNVSIVAYHNGTAQGLSGAQATVDSTGKAVDVLRRIEVRLPVVNTGGLLPGSAISSNGAICKRFSISSTYFEIPADIVNHDAKNAMCNQKIVGTP